MTRITSRHWIFAGAVALLAACQQPAPAPMAPPPKEVEIGSIFLLNSPLAFPPGTAELLFQNEQDVTAANLSPNMPYCRLRPDSGAPTVIASGRLTAGAVSYEERESGTTGGMVSVTRIPLSTAAGAPSQGFLTAGQIFNAIGKQFSMGLPR